jgi:hypothetical protein
MVEQETGLAIQRAATDGSQQMSDQPARHIRYKQHRTLPRRQAACTHACQRAFGSAVTEYLRAHEIASRTHAVVPVIALHAVFVARDQRQRQRMSRAAFAPDKTVRVRIHRHALSGLHAGPVGIADARMRAAGVLDFDAQFDRPCRVDIPRMPQVQVGKRGRHARCVSQPGRWIRLGVAGDRTGLIQGRLNRVRVQVGRAGRALALTEVHGKPETAVAGVLDRLHLAQSHIDAQPGIDAGCHFGLAGASGAGAADHILGQFGQSIELLLAAIRPA